jgi:hypothetical protein
MKPAKPLPWPLEQLVNKTILMKAGFKGRESKFTLFK